MGRDPLSKKGCKKAVILPGQEGGTDGTFQALRVKRGVPPTPAQTGLGKSLPPSLWLGCPLLKAI